MINNILNTLHKHAAIIAGWIAIYFAPAFPFILIVGFFVIVDTITGCLAAQKRSELITSKRFSDVFPKFIVYALAILTAHVVQDRFFPEFAAMKLIAGLVAYNELMSIDENIKSITGFSMFKAVIQRFSVFKKRR